MKLILIVLVLQIIFQSAYGDEVSPWAIKESWTTSLGENEASCSIYRKRVANYYQRISETDYATRATSGNFTVTEISNMIDLWKRTNVPLMHSETATYIATFYIGDWSDYLTDAPSIFSVKIQSPLLNWEADKFAFPEGTFNVLVDKSNQSLRVEFKAPYSIACLQNSEMNVLIKNNDGDMNLKFKLNLNKTKWDKEQIEGPSKYDFYMRKLYFANEYQAEQVASGLAQETAPIAGVEDIFKELIKMIPRVRKDFLPSFAISLLKYPFAVRDREILLDEIINIDKFDGDSLGGLANLVRQYGLSNADKVLQDIINSPKANDCSMCMVADAIFYYDKSFGTQQGAQKMIRQILATLKGSQACLTNAITNLKIKDDEKLKMLQQVVSSVDQDGHAFVKIADVLKELKIKGIDKLFEQIIAYPNLDSFVLKEVMSSIELSRNREVNKKEESLCKQIEERIKKLNL